MVDKLRTKSGGAAIPVTIGDFADVGVDRTYPLIYLVFNTLFALLTQDEQMRCFANVAEHLDDGGRFVIECFVPDLTLYSNNQSVRVERLDVDRVILDASRIDPATQRVDAQHIVLRDGDVRLYPVSLRYAWPAELDVMAQHAGLQLEQRWAHWDCSPFGPSSPKHVSVYQR
jgi:hypothetical protein